MAHLATGDPWFRRTVTGVRPPPPCPRGPLVAGSRARPCRTRDRPGGRAPARRAGAAAPVRRADAASRAPGNPDGGRLSIDGTYLSSHGTTWSGFC